MTDLYENDMALWSERQAGLLRRRVTGRPSLHAVVPRFIDDEMAGAREEAMACLDEDNELMSVDLGSLKSTIDQVLGLPGGTV